MRVTADNQRMKTTRISAPITFANPGLSPPTISLRRPFPDDTLSGSRTVNWVTADVRNDPRLISIYYSADGGREAAPTQTRWRIQVSITSILRYCQIASSWLVAVVARGSLMGQNRAKVCEAFNPRNPTISLSVTNIHAPSVNQLGNRLVRVDSGGLVIHSLETELRCSYRRLAASGAMDGTPGSSRVTVADKSSCRDRGTAVEIRLLLPVDTLQLLPFLP